MDAENDNDQPNSSSASASSSSSNNSSSSNLLGHLPMLPFMRSTDDDEPEADGEGSSAADGHDNDLTEEPMPLQPRVTAAPRAAPTAAGLQQQPTLAPITTTTASNSAQATAAAMNNSSSLGREEPMQHHQSSLSPSPPPTQLQQAPNIETTTTTATLSPTQSASVSSSATLQQQFAASDLSHQQDQEHQLTAHINRSDIADTIDASAVIVQPLEANAEHPQHPHLYPQEAANSSEELGQAQPPNDIHLDDNDNNDFDVDLNLRNDGALANPPPTNHQQQQSATQQSISLDTSASDSAGPSSSGQQQQQQQAPQIPTTLPLLLQQQQQQQQQNIEQPETEESKHLPSFDHHYHNNPNDYHQLHSNSYQHSSSSSAVFPFCFRPPQLTHSNGAHNTSSNNHLYGNTMSSSNRNHGSTSGIAGGTASAANDQVVDRIKLLYPNVNEDETPLPRCWSAHEKCLSIGLSQNNLRVHFKGKQSNDAASVRTAHPIPTACGIYYFEVKIISKGKNGYMGIGLTAQQFRMNRLPGWDKQSYGYHGDDGNSFSSSGHGQSYGPTFTTGDIIGCCVNFVNNTCFYTKNGVDLGIAFRELPTRLYPTVGLQTPGEEVDANFGQEPFKFTQIEDMMKQMRGEVNSSIYDFPLPAEQGDPTTLLQKMVHSYLVHNGYSQTAEAFGRQKPGQNQKEDMTSIRNRQKILKLVMTGKMGQAIDQTMRTYPGILENNKNLLFMLKCRQFIEMINGSDVEYCPYSSPTSITDNKTTNSITTQTSVPHQTSVIQSTKLYQNGNEQNNSSNGNGTTAEDTTATAATTTTTTTTTNSSSNTTNSTTINNAQNSSHITVINTDNDLKTQTNLNNEHCTTSNDDAPITISKSNNDNDYLNDVEMENNGHTNGNICKNGNTNNLNDSIDADEDMDVDVAPSIRKYSHGIERILEFGKELSQMGQQLEKENKMTDEERQMLEDAFSLIAYSNPWASPLGWQLCPTKRETVCRSLNSAILESMSFPRWSPMEYCVAHANELLKVMSQSNLGSCAFINITDVFPQN